jgi:hypothetical protein
LERRTASPPGGGGRTRRWRRWRRWWWWWRRRRRRRRRRRPVEVRVARVTAELTPLDAAVVRAVQVEDPDLVVLPPDAAPGIGHDHELVPSVEIDFCAGGHTAQADP